MRTRHHRDLRLATSRRDHTHLAVVVVRRGMPAVSTTWLSDWFSESPSVLATPTREFKLESRMFFTAFSFPAFYCLAFSCLAFSTSAIQTPMMLWITVQWTKVGTSVISSITATDEDPSDSGYLVYSIDQANQFAVSMEQHLAHIQQKDR